MNKVIKTVLTGTVTALVLMSATATAAYDTNPYVYEGQRNGCTWDYSWSTGGNWGVAHFYVPVGTCSYSQLQINITNGASQINYVYSG